MSEIYQHRMMCAAAMTRPVPDCEVATLWRSRTKVIDPLVLTGRGWRLDHDKWVCPANHRPDLHPNREAS